MKIALFLATLLVLCAFAFGPVFVFTQTADAQAPYNNELYMGQEQEGIKELQAIVVQLLKLVAELQHKLLVVTQAQTPAAFACGQAEITWQGVSGATDYILYRNGIEVYAGKDLKFLDKGLIPGVTYAYAVRARNAGGLGPVSPVQAITTPPQCPPAAPFISVQEGLVCGGNIQVSWTRVQGANFFEVFRGNTRVFSGNTVAFTERGLTPGQSYSYKVRAGNTGGVGQFSQETNAKASVVCPPAAPKAPVVKDPVSESVAKEALFDVATHGSPSGATAESGGVGVIILSFQASAKLSPVVLDRVDVDFSDRPWLFLSSVELLDGGNVVSKIEITQDSFVQTGDSGYRLRFANVAITVPEGGTKTISIRVSAKENLLLAQPRQLTVSIPTNGVHGKDEAGVPHEGPRAEKVAAFTKTFFVKRKL